MSDNSNKTQPSFSSGIISTELFGRIDFSKLESGLKRCENWFVRPAGGVTYRTGTKYVANVKYADKDVSLIPFVYNRDDGLCLEFGDKYIRFYKDGEQILLNAQPYEIATTYTEKEVGSIKYVQDKNKIYLVHKNHAPAVLERTADTDWTLRDLVFNPTLKKPLSISIKALEAKDKNTVVTFNKWQYAASVVDKDGVESLPVFSNVIASDIDLLNQNISVTITLDNAELSKLDKVNYYRVKGGEFFLVYTEKVKPEVTTYIITDISLVPNETKSPKEEFKAFEDRNYPSAIGYWNQRLLLGGTYKKPNTFWGSCVGRPEDFTKTFVLADDESFELTFNSGTVDAITDFITMDDLIVFTESKIWRVRGTAVSNMSAYVESYTGSSGIRPYVSKKSILFIDSTINTVSNFVYSYELNGYSGQQLDVLARSNFDGYRLKDITFRDTPYGVLYAVRSDGDLMCLTYMREENVYAWHKHTTEGYFRAVCNVDRDENDQVYTIVERANGKYVELFQDEINAVQGIDDSWHLDCASRFFANWQEWKGDIKVESKKYLAYKGKKQNDAYYCWDIFEYSFGHIGHDIYSFGYVYTKDANPKDDTPIYGYNNGKHEIGDYATNVNQISRWRITWKELLDMKLGFDVLRAKRASQYDVILNEVPPYEYIYCLSKITGEPVFEKRGENFFKVGTIDQISGNVITSNNFKYDATPSKDVIVKSDDKVGYLYTEKDPKSGDLAYTEANGSGGIVIDEVTDTYILVDGIKYYKQNSDIRALSSVSHLDRFNGKKVTVLADGNVWKKIEVKDGTITLPVPSYNVLIGYPFRGLIETIPQESVFKSGSSSVGLNKNVTDTTIFYNKMRGLWYGVDENHLYEIKPYTERDFGDQIPLASGKLTLNTADGFSPDASLIITQESPLPAMIQSITLGVLINGKN